ncbi:SDR family NAD(P)-dependent oxidoreductase [Amycolatopsis sp. MEPSY49]|uniref:SDR family NAD(P)-dependent oxidoreductase n=1 Tax=Amycolatopsis sp. MEPSY49 TaxID=3151600 RepID=UPI003EF5EEE9
MELKDQQTVVTGGASGLGLATVRRFHAAGAHVTIADLPSSPGTALAAELGARVRFVAADVTDEDAVRAALAAGEAPRVVVNCAGIAPPKRVLGKDGTPHDLGLYRKVVEVNLVGSFNVLRLAAEAMRLNEPLDGDRGVIVLTASIAAFDGQIGQAAYSSSKAGVHGLTLTAARDLAEHYIRVCAIAPGIFETPMLLGLPQAAQDSLGKQIPHPSRLGRPDEFAHLAGHVVANPMLNGETIRLDGAVRMPPR